MPLDRDGFLVVNRDTTPPEPEKEYPKQPPPIFHVLRGPFGWTAIMIHTRGKFLDPDVRFLKTSDGKVWWNPSKKKTVERCWDVYDSMNEWSRKAWDNA